MTVVFPTCLVELVRPDVGAAFIRVLERRGHQPVIAKGTTCCGQPAWNGGFAEEARRVASRTLKALARTDGPIVIPSGSCTSMISHSWPTLFEGTRKEGAAKAVARRVVEFSDFLADASIDALTEKATAVGRVTVHDSCHGLRELGSKHQSRTLLEQTGYELCEAPGAERCCGFGGTFSVKLPAVAGAMADDKIEDFTATGAEQVVGCDASCLLHLQGRADKRETPIRFVHLATVLDEADRATGR